MVWRGRHQANRSARALRPVPACGLESADMNDLLRLRDLLRSCLATVEAASIGGHDSHLMPLPGLRERVLDLPVKLEEALNLAEIIT